MPFEKLGNDHIDALRMDASLLAHAGCIVGNDHCDDHPQCKGRAVQTIVQTNGKGRGSHQGGMGAGHAARRQKQSPVPASSTQIIQGDLDHLCQGPGGQPGDECLVLEQCQEIHSESSSKGRTSSPATCFTLSSAASSSTPQWAA